MGIINWVQSRFHGKTEIRRFDGAAVRSSRGAAVQEESYQAVPEAEKHLNADEWPQAGLLSVGTLGNEEPLVSGDRCTVEDLPEFTVEEVEKLQDALARLLRRAKSKSSARGSGAGEDSPPLDRFLNCPSSLEVDRRGHTKHGDGDGENGDLSPDTKIILAMARDLLTNSSKGSTRHKSLKFLLKKAFVWNGGFTTLASSLKDLVESRMEKFFRTVLGEKINARPSNSTTASRKYFLEDPAKGRRQGDRRRGCEEGEKEESCRWDRTDSEFIVLEI